MNLKKQIINTIQKSLETPCGYCGIRESIWFYGPGSQEACDKCVPRGCSCNKELKPEFEKLYFENPDNVDLNNPDLYYEPLDEMGRKYPCCEWMMWYKYEKSYEEKMKKANSSGHDG